MEHINFTYDSKNITEIGHFEGYASVFGVKDHGGEIVERGAFSRSVKGKGAKNIRMFSDHDPTKRVGVWEEIHEDETGLFVKGRLLLEKNIGKDAYIDLKNGALDGLSIGGRTISGSFDAKKNARVIKDFDLFEISLVSFPMNHQSRVNSVKSLTSEEARAIESCLRGELKLSKSAAVSAVAIMKKHLRGAGAVENADAYREDDAGAIAELTARFRAISANP